MDCGYKFRASQIRKGTAEAPKSPRMASNSYSPSKPPRRSGWIALSIIMLVLGVILGIGAWSLSGINIKTVMSTVTQIVTQPTTIIATKSLPPSIITTTSTIIKTETTTKTLATTIISIQTITITTTPKPPEVAEITSAKVVIKDDLPYLYVKFNTTMSAKIKLIGPDGEEKDFKMVSPDETGAYLCMTGYRLETPLLGKYKVVLEALYGKLAEKTLEFTGYSVKATKLDFKDKKWNDFFGGSINEIVIYLKNEGDLPTYVGKAKVVFDGEEKLYNVYSKAVPPGESRISISVWMTGISAGTHVVKVTLINDKGEEIATIQGEVTFP